MFIARDITERRRQAEERKRLENQLAQAQKMESLGTLAGGIAHDFNNILAVIINYSQLATWDVSDPDKAKLDIEEVVNAAKRARDLVKQILTFSRKAESSYSPVELRTVINESLKMLRSAVPSSIEIRRRVEASGLVMSDPAQINQILMNLCTNAVHAMDQNGVGVMEVTLEKVFVEDPVDKGPGLKPGPCFKLTVRDNGSGIPPDIMDRIFDPFFTTKEVGQGTGLGLSVVLGIVNNHRGAITCRSELGKGTVFEVYLPEYESTDESSKERVRPQPLRGNARVLFVDDDPAILTAMGRMLTKLGYRVVTQASSVDALELFRRNPGDFDLVVTDMTMPQMTGDRFARELMEIRRDIPVIMCTGHSDHISEDKAQKMGIREFLMKPIEMEELSITIRRVLSQGR